MKRKHLLLSLLIINLALTSCGEVKSFRLEDKYYNQENLAIDDISKLNEAYNIKESFVVLSYSSISCINDFK